MAQRARLIEFLCQTVFVSALLIQSQQVDTGDRIRCARVVISSAAVAAAIVRRHGINRISTLQSAEVPAKACKGSLFMNM